MRVMSNRMLTLFSLLILICIGALLAVKFLPYTAAAEGDGLFASRNGTRGSAVIHSSKPWTLNFEQQNDLISYLNEGENIGKELIENAPSQFPYSKIVIYQFDKGDLTFTPVNYQGDNIVFDAPQVVENGYVLEGSDGKLKQLLLGTFDQ